MTPDPWLGKAVIIRTVGSIFTGRLVEATPQELVLEDAAWIADTGRWSEALATGSLSEVEPYLDPVRVGRGVVVDWTLWRHALPRVVR